MLHCPFLATASQMFNLKSYTYGNNRHRDGKEIYRKLLSSSNAEVSCILI